MAWIAVQRHLYVYPNVPQRFFFQIYPLCSILYLQQRPITIDVGFGQNDRATGVRQRPGALSEPTKNTFQT